MHVLVTGGAGFIGSHTVAALLSAGHRVSVWDDFSTGRRENLAGSLDRLTLIEADVRDLKALLSAAERLQPDAILHLAGVASLTQSIEEPVLTHSINLGGALNVLETARRLAIERVVLASSAAVYGEPPRLPWCEEMQPDPRSPYGLQKWQCEQYALLYWNLYSVSSICLRYFNIYGPRQDPASPYSGVISTFAQRLLERGRPVIFGDGQQTRDFVYVADVAQANLLALTFPHEGHRTLNIATGREVSVLRALQVLASIVGYEADPEFRPARPGEVRRSAGEVSRAATVLGSIARTSLEDGLRETYGA